MLVARVQVDVLAAAATQLSLLCASIRWVTVSPGKNPSKELKWERKKETALRWQFQKSCSLDFFFFFFLWSAPRRSFGGKIIFPLSSSVIPSVNSSGGISLLSDARWHYLLRGRWLQSATGLNSPRRCWDRGLDDILFLWWICECMCVRRREGQRESSPTTVSCVGWKAKNLIERRASISGVLNGLCNCHHNSLMLFSEGIKMIQCRKKLTAATD